MPALGTFIKAGQYALFTLLAAVALLLVGTAMPVGGYSAYIVQSGSMEPAIGAGSVVVVRPAEQYQKGDVITFQRPGDAISTTHRIVEVRVQEGQYMYTTKGDNNDSADDVPVAKTAVKGTVLFSVPQLGYVLTFAKRPAGFAVLVGVPAAWIIGSELRDIVRALRERTS